MSQTPPTQVEDSTKWHLDKKVSVTHIFATISAISAIVVFGANIDKRLSLVETSIAAALTAQAAVDARQDTDRNEIKRQLREDMKDIGSKIDRLTQAVMEDKRR